MAKKKTEMTAISAKEIKAWLRGIQEFQPKNWTPTADQWKTIQDKIFNLSEDETVVEQTSPSYRPQQRYYAPENVVYDPGIQHVAVEPSGPLATAMSTTGTGMISASSQDTVIAGEYKSGFA